MTLMARPTLGYSAHHSHDPGGSMFREASGINIHGGTFNAYGSGGADEKRITDAMALLRSRAEHGAPYDAAAREDVPKCHERTRVAIIHGIHMWAHSREPDAPPLMWMYGPAGSGKTTIMQTVAETFDKEGSLAASFFFSRLAATRPSEKQMFVTTLAHQLSLCIPALQQHIADALSDQSIVTKSLAEQLDALVIGPLKKLDPAQTAPRYIYMVDGLDECDGYTSQRDILDILERLLHQSPHPVRILVACRNLSHLQAFFSQERIKDITQTTPLDNDYQSDADITNFLAAQFEKIRDEHPARSRLHSEWPSPADISVLVSRASGQFIYASVVMKFIASHGQHPNESLQTIISLKVDDSARPYEELDAVYAQVLSTIEPQNVEFCRILMGCLILDESDWYFARVVQTHDTIDVDSIFMLQHGTTDARINRMHPLLTTGTTKYDRGTRFTHASFPEYLLDCSRSKEFFLDMSKVHCSLVHCWLELYSEWFRVRRLSGIVLYRGLVPSDIPYYECRAKYVRDGEDGRVLVDMVRHCIKAKWTPELKQDILAFDIPYALTVLPGSSTDPHLQHIRWIGVVLWLDLTFWMKQQHHISSAEADRIQHCIQDMIQSLFSIPSFSSSVVRLVVAILTGYHHFDMTTWWYRTCTLRREVLWLDSLMDFFDLPTTDHLRGASCSWLCKILVPDSEINGSFFVNRNLYTDAALQYARSHKYSSNVLATMLSVVLPSKELATLLKQKFLQIHNSDSEPRDLDRLFLSVCIYLFECGIPFHSEHQHGPEFKPLDGWVCGICLLFDPFSAYSECVDIELSRDPLVKPGLQHAQIADEEVPYPLQINPVRPLEPIPGAAPLLWVQIWIIWLADMAIRFFPVVA